MIAEIVNAKRPGTARYVGIPNSDHAFRTVANIKESFDFWSKGGKDFNPAILEVLTKWADETVGK